MGFDVADMPCIGLRFRQRPADRAGLRLRIRYRVTVRLATMIERAATDDSVDVVAISLGLREPFQYDDSYALSRNVSVSAFAEALAMAVAGDELPSTQHQIFIRMNADIHTAGNRQTGAPML